MNITTTRPGIEPEFTALETDSFTTRNLSCYNFSVSKTTVTRQVFDTDRIEL